MISEQEQFRTEAEVLDHADFLADVAVTLSPDDAASVLIGAALKVWEREFGSAGALQVAERVLKTVIGARQSPKGVH